MSLEYDYPDDTPTREETAQVEADRDLPECICENAAKKLYNPDCYWHGTEGVLLPEEEHQSNALPRVSGSEPERQLPLDYVGALPAAYDRRATPRPEVLDRREYQTKFAQELRTMRERLKEEV